MNCQKKDCLGTINTDININLQTGCNCCFGRALAHPCNQCGRLHWSESGNLVFNRAEEAAYLENGQIVHKQQSQK